MSSEAEFEIFSGALIVRYLICLANYYYLYDRDDDVMGEYLLDCAPDINRQVLTQKAWAKLDEAKQHIEVRLKQYVVVREPSQGIFSPHYALLGRIFFVRAKLMTFFSRYVPEDREVLKAEGFVGQQRTAASTHWGRLYLLEKARLYAAAEGDSEVYACYSAMQSYLYLAAAYTKPENLASPTSKESLTRLGCLQWAETLRNHALLTYAETGRQCYYDIKEKSGLPDEFDDYGYDKRGLYRIGKIPGILEVRGAEKERVSKEDDDFITLDISLLGVMPTLMAKLTPQHPTENIYLFGTNACYLFFIRGLYLLCSNDTEEFKRQLGREIDWERKLKTAIRLLNMAWAIAEDGCRFENIKKEIDGEVKSVRQISRSFSDEAASGQYTSKEISSVRDLYPRRVNEIADLGKIFAAACMVLRLRCAPIELRPQLEADIQKILGMLHGHYRLQNQRTLGALLRRQTRYNGHLAAYLSGARDTIRRYMLADAFASNDVETCRDELVAALFKGLLDAN